MKRSFALIIIVLTVNICFGQNVDRNVVAQLYAKTIESYFDQLASQQVENDKPLPEFILVNDSSKNVIPIEHKNFILKIVKDKAEGVKEIEKLREKTGAIFKISQKFNKDTLDISINRVGVSIKAALQIQRWHLVTKHIFLSADCGGTNGYIPTGRMLYSHSSQLWLYCSGGEILAEMKKKNHYL